MKGWSANALSAASASPGLNLPLNGPSTHGQLPRKAASRTIDSDERQATVSLRSIKAHADGDRLPDLSLTRVRPPS
jgi:hypothetical protein